MHSNQSATMFLRLLVTVLLLACSTLALAKESNTGYRIVVFGDSLVSGYGLQKGQSFPQRLGQALERKGVNATVYNSGNAGDTTAAALARLDWTLHHRPHLAIVVLGANDFFRGFRPQQTKRNLTAIIERFKSKGVKVLLAGMKAPHNLGARYQKAFDRIYPFVAKQKRVALYPFFLQDVALVAALNQVDGIHPNNKGVAVIVRNILPKVLSLVPSTFKK